MIKLTESVINVTVELRCLCVVFHILKRIGRMVRKLAMAMVVSGALGSSYANALGLGEIKLNSALNQPLDAQVKLLNVGDLSENEILPNLASHDDFARAGVERVFFLTGIKFDVELDGKGGATLHLTTDRIVREPFLNFLIELHWPSGRLLREYTALLDPPLFSETAAAPVQQSASGTPMPVQSTPTPVTQQPTYGTSSASQSGSQSVSVSTTNGEKGGTVRVKKNDTLWGIAKENRPDQSVTVRQTMVAIQQNNPQAFINNNINLLKSGQILRIPEVGEIRRISSREAYSETQRQMAEWQGKKTIDATQSYSASKDEVSTADQAGLVKLVATQDELDNEIEAGSGTGDNFDGAAAAGDGSGTGSSAVEDVDALQKQLDDLQRLMTLKQEQLALLQATQAEEEAQAQAESELVSAAEEVAKAEELVAESETPEGAVNTTGEALDESVVPVAEGMTAGAETQDVAAELSENSSTTEVVKPEEKAPVTPAPEQQRPQEGVMDILLNNPLYIGVLLVVILGGLILLGAISRRRKEEQDYPEESQQTIDNVNDAIDIPDNLEEQVDQVETENTVNLADSEPLVGAAGEADSKADEVRKLLDESDIFIAYGRYERAIEILQPAVNDNPQNTALHLKLAEVYLLNKDEARFTQQETDLHAIGDAEAISSLEALKEKYADLLAVASQPEQVEELDFDIEQNDSPADEPETLTSAEAIEEEDFLSFDLDEDEVADKTADAELSDLEFDLPSDQVEIPEEPVATEPEAHDNLVDFESESVDDAFNIDIEEDSVASDSELEFSLDDELADAKDSEATGADDLDFLVDTDESATKLELAKAYIDMADTEAAQEILNEVVSEGSEAQQQEAKKLLENLE
ncbi:putative type IV pilus assembly FimV-related transmembrane protein [gamma proteobacterium IMCC2047]|nr:putative type IV pilus assembly FimV-related transmembrane protein [gamma proteobacterium IMCC2047]